MDAHGVMGKEKTGGSGLYTQSCTGNIGRAGKLLRSVAAVEGPCSHRLAHSHILNEGFVSQCRSLATLPRTHILILLVRVLQLLQQVRFLSP